MNKGSRVEANNDDVDCILNMVCSKRGGNEDMQSLLEEEIL